MAKQPASFEGAVAAAVDEWIHRYVPAVAERLGPLPDTVQPSTREKVERWNLRTGKVQPGPMTDALADEAVQMVLQEHQQSGQAPPEGDRLKSLVAAKVNAVLYEYRADVYGTGLPKPKDRVREAERFRRLAEKSAPPEPALPEAAPMTTPVPSIPAVAPVASEPYPAAIMGMAQEAGVAL